MGDSVIVDEKAPERKLRDQECNALRGQVWAGRQANFESLDKYLLTLSSGALALSLSLIKDVVPLYSAHWFAALVVSWIAFVGAILSTVASFVASQLAHDRQLDNLEKYQQGDGPALDEQCNPFVTWTQCLNYFAVVAFFVGVVSTVAFVALNTSEARAVNTQNKQTESGEHKGIVPPGLPRPQPPRQPESQKPVVPPPSPKQGGK
jgi:hypothetical protein